MLFRDRFISALYRSFGIAVLLAAISWVSSVPGIAQQSVRVSIEKTGEELSQTEVALDASRRIKAKLDAEVSESKWEVLHVQRKLVHAAAEAQDIEARISALESDLAWLEDEQREKMAALEHRRGELSWTLGALQRIGHMPPDLLIFLPASLQEISHARLLLRNVVGALDAQVEILGEELLDMTSLGERISAQRDLIDLEAERLESQRAQLDALLARKTQVYNRAEAQHIRAEAMVASLAAEAKNLHEFLENLVAEHERNERALRAAKASAKAEDIAVAMAEQERSAVDELEKPRVPSDRQQIASISVTVQPDNMGFQGIESVVAQKVDGRAPNKGGKIEIVEGDLSVLTLVAPRPPVISARGTFTMPARGVLVSGFDESTDLGLSTKGIVIETRSEAQIIAPYDGRIAFAGRFRKYDLLLIIDHGEGYHTLLAGMGRIDVMAGQGVLAGEPVGVMRSVADGALRLYVELRSDGQPINPLPWLAAETTKVSG